VGMPTWARTALTELCDSSSYANSDAGAVEASDV
jgi:hypothetical protein